MKQELVNLLSERSVEVTFTKKDGTERVMNCTRSSDLIPSIHYPKNESERSDTNQIRVFDLDQRAWRSFIIESVIKYV